MLSLFRINTVQTVTTLCLCMQYIISYNFNLLEVFVNIINYKHYLIINAKYHRSNMYDAHTMSLATCRLPHKSHMADSILFKF